MVSEFSEKVCCSTASAKLAPVAYYVKTVMKNTCAAQASFNLIQPMTTRNRRMEKKTFGISKFPRTIRNYIKHKENSQEDRATMADQLTASPIVVDSGPKGLEARAVVPPPTESLNSQPAGEEGQKKTHNQIKQELINLVPKEQRSSSRHLLTRGVRHATRQPPTMGQLQLAR